MDFDDRGFVDEIHFPGVLRRPQHAETAVEVLYQAYAPGLIRLAYVMLGDRPAAEDVVQEAFCGLYRRWEHLTGPDRALSYVRSAVLNGCRSALRRQAVRRAVVTFQPPAASAEALVLGGEERQEVMQAVRRLMSIRPSTVRSAAARALDTLGRALKEPS